LTVFAFLKINEVEIPRALKSIALSLGFLFLGFTSFLANALPVFTLPKPTGNYAVGIQYFHFIDDHRTDPFLDTSTQKRELMVKAYYPAAGDDAKPFAAYFHNSPELIKLFSAFYGMPDFMFDHLRLVKTNSKEQLQLADQQQRYPVVLFSHGAGTTMEVQTSQSEDLASHGYIVLAIDHPYVSAATIFPDRIVSHKEATTDFITPEPAEIITQIMAEDVSFVMDQLMEINEGKIDSMFAGRLDLENIGEIGHSVGGAVAYHLALNDPRVKAAINLDGRVYVTSKVDPSDIAPFLMLASDTYHVQTLQERKSLMEKFEELTSEEQNILLSMYGSKEAYQEAYGKDTQNVIGLIEVLADSGNLFTIEGSDHMKFADIGLFIGIRQLRESINIRGATDPARCLEITEAVTLAFFDQYLKGEPNRSLDFLIEKYPELKRVDLR
jgi:predicted dienelactone hydrolase